ncbi:hypothetical protein MXD62_04355 [Frankia sp. Mgl5]|uniref:hypothetical protein n=1 Tax=Frankia sp. Mgl5 TaxID=2933793 RepID=UPI0020106D68|nr:hypothetical protein [Frankia sp. Mgl5]MCK9926407.1 hypothetical protein [Frankia sp. Mgl5]
MPEGADTLTGQNAGQDIVGNRIISQCQDAGTRRQSGVRAAVKRGSQLHRHGHRRVGPQADWARNLSFDVDFDILRRC